MGKETRV